MYVDDSSTDFNYCMIISWDLLKELGIILTFGPGMMIWQNVAVIMKDLDTTMEQLYHVCNDPVDPEHDRV